MVLESFLDSLVGFFNNNIFPLIIILATISLPLYFAVKFLGGKTGFWRSIVAVVAIDVLIVVITARVSTYVGLAVLLATIAIYKFAYELTYKKAFYAWMLKYVFAFLIIYGFRYFGWLR